MGVKAVQQQQKQLCEQRDAIGFPHQNFLSEGNPLGFNAGDTNLYRYVGNDPTNATDPRGLEKILSDKQIQENIDKHHASGGFARDLRDVKDVIVPKPPPSLEVVLRDPTVLAALQKAWAESNPNAAAVPAGTPGSTKQEQGGWIIWDGGSCTDFLKGPGGRSGGLSIQRVPAGQRDRLPLGKKPAGAIAWFHTHPNTAAEGYSPNPSPADTNLTKQLGVPGIIETHQGRKIMRP